MNSRKYIGALIIVLTVLGVAYQQQITLPNQELVLQFTDVTLTSDEAQNTIAVVKKQLQDIGVNNIQVKQEANGTLRIAYYSLKDVNSIKETLFEENQSQLANNSDNQKEKQSSLPVHKKTISFNLDVHEIQKVNNGDWNLVETDILRLKLEKNRLINPKDFKSIHADINDKEKTKIVKVSYRIHKNSAIAINHTLYTIPEVRAGPIA